MNPVSFCAVRGASELSANAFVIEAHGCRLLLDAGARQGRRPGWVGAIERPEMCWVSHVHWDHAGALAPLLSRWPRLGCVCSAPTRRLAPMALASGGVDPARAQAVASQLQAVPSRRYFGLARYSDNPGVQKFQLMHFPAGHLPGAAMLLVEVDIGGERPFRLLYTGDFCGHDQPLTPGALFPRAGSDFPIDVLVMEGVLATRKAYDEVDYAGQMAELAETAGAHRGAVLIGAARLGSGAEVIAQLARDGRDVVAHEMFESVLDASGAGRLDGVRFADESGCRQALESPTPGAAVVVAPGEQYESGSPAARLLGRVVGREDALVVVLNRAYKKSLAGRLVRAEAGELVRVDGRQQQLRARVAHVLVGNHAPRGQLVGAVQAVEPARVLLVHGHRSQLFSLKRAIQKHGYAGPIDVPENGERVDLASPQ